MTPAPSPHHPKPVLRLGPRPPAAPSPAAVNVSRSIDKIIKQTNSPFGGEPRTLDKGQADELEAALRELEAQLHAREESIRLLEVKLADRERDLAETDALLRAREALFTAERRRDPAAPGAGPITEELRAYEKLKAEVEAQVEGLKESKWQLREREKYLEEAETHLLDRMAAHHERETAVEKREAELREREK
jgi:(p)ppGpp synthase/HD superfamily hydrolase